MSYKLCKHCGIGFMAASNDIYGLVKVEVVDKSIRIHGDRVMPCNVEVCSNCGHVDLSYKNLNKELK